MHFNLVSDDQYQSRANVCSDYCLPMCRFTVFSVCVHPRLTCIIYRDTDLSFGECFKGWCDRANLPFSESLRKSVPPLQRMSMNHWFTNMAIERRCMPCDRMSCLLPRKWSHWVKSYPPRNLVFYQVSFVWTWNMLPSLSSCCLL